MALSLITKKWANVLVRKWVERLTQDGQQVVRMQCQLWRGRAHSPSHSIACFPSPRVRLPSSLELNNRPTFLLFTQCLQATNEDYVIVQLFKFIVKALITLRIIWKKLFEPVPDQSNFEGEPDPYAFPPLPSLPIPPSTILAGPGQSLVTCSFIIIIMVTFK